MKVIISLIVIVSNLLLANCISGDCFDGMGTMVYYDGSKYVGQSRFMMHDGEGTHYYANGNKYIGEWKHNSKDGKGTFYYADGDKYIGEWKNDKMEGKGTYFWANGDKYIGEWKNDKKEEKGTYFLANGDKYIGEWKNDEMEGKGTYFWANGNSEERFYQNGKKVTQNYSSSQTNSKETSSTESSSTQAWSSIDYEELYKLISGNTLISKNKLFCSRNSSKDSCLKIAVLEPSKSFHIGRVKATVILPDKKKIIDDEWGYYAVNAFHIGIHTGITKIPTNSSQYRWDDIVKMNSEKNMIKISNGNIEILISIQQGQNKKLIANARNGNYKKFDYTGSMTIGQALVGKAVEKIGESLAEVGKNPPSNESYCYSSDIKSDRDRQMCLAISKGDKTYCFSSDIKNDRDRQMCIASATRDDNYCYSSDIKNDRDRQMCLATTTRDKNYCYSSDIKSDRDRQMCLATTTRDKNYCYSSDIKSDRDQAMCLASATGDKNYCYSSDITSDRDRQMCLAQTR